MDFLLISFFPYMGGQDDGGTLEIETFLDEAVTSNCEGLMIKTLEENATYEPTRRWVVHASRPPTQTAYMGWTCRRAKRCHVGRWSYY